MKREILTPFSELAKELQLSFQTVSNDEAELASDRYIVRVSEEIDRVKGIFVTIARRETPSKEIGLSYLIEYRGGTRSEVEVTTGNDPKSICALVKRYAASFLVGAANDFGEFESFARRKVEERFPQTRPFKTNKWVRAEWVDDPQ